MDISNLNGIGPKTVKLYNKLGINTVEDLLTYYPYRYNIYKFSNLIESNEEIIVKAIIESIPNVFYIKKNLNRMSFRVNVNNKVIVVNIFNRAFMKLNLTIGKEIVLIGKYQKNIFTASDIKFDIKNGDIEPIYHLTKGLTNNTLIKIINNNLNKYIIEDYIPKEYLNKYNFISKMDALNKIHNPLNSKDVKVSKVRLIYEELFNFSFKMNYLNRENKNIIGIPKKFNDTDINKLINSLPFKLTNDQEKATNEILNDLKNKNRMNRLLLGDVGSGKTVVAAISSYATYLSGYQSSIMAPTEILAIQHYEGIKEIFKNTNVTIGLITGSMTKKEKNNIYKDIENGKIDLLIGTHSILNDELKFKNLGLVITDEQHRFGVNQRSIFQNKSDSPDILYLSATPIPRTYAMTIYGDMDISMIKSKPNGRKDIITKVKSESEIKDVLKHMYEEICNGHQIYIVSPLVEQNDELDLKSVEFLKEKMDLAFNNKVRSEIIHGKMKQSEKDQIMNDFKNNDIKILISTTVIEVGIDVENATMIVIFNAERFGLASLHQLRGRVGRNDLQSYCYLICNYDNKRLKVMEESNDGFYISEKDFEMRGEGDLFGTKQSGDMVFKLANLKTNYDILVQTKNDVEEYINNKDYLNNSYYNNLSKSLNIVD